MDCSRAEELFSDHLEGVLAEPLHSELKEHLAGCTGCTSLLAAVSDVVETLRSSPSLEPPSSLAERVARAALAKGVPLSPPSSRMPVRVQVTAGILAVAASLVLFLGVGAFASGEHAIQHAAQRANNLGAWALERKDRLMEDLRILRVVVSTALEGRLDLDDYKRVLERKKSADPTSKKKKDGAQGATLLYEAASRSYP